MLKLTCQKTENIYFRYSEGVRHPKVMSEAGGCGLARVRVHVKLNNIEQWS